MFDPHYMHHRVKTRLARSRRARPVEHPTDRLSRCASALLRLARAEESADADPFTRLAPGECRAQIHRSLVAARLRALSSHGYTPRTFYDAVEERMGRVGARVHFLVGVLLGGLDADDGVPVYWRCPSCGSVERSREALPYCPDCRLDAEPEINP